MCYHVATPNEAKLKAFLSGDYTVEAYNGLFHASGYAHPNLPATTQAAPKNVQQLRWGLIPAWVKQEDQAKEIALKTLNARSETAHQLPSYKDSIVHQRCIIYLDGFFEWQHRGKSTHPYFIYPADGSIFRVGGIYSIGRDALGGADRHTCSILTTEANGLMSELHNTKKRMPFILTSDKCAQWLDKQQSIDEIRAMMIPCEERLLSAHEVAPINPSGNNNRASVQEPYRSTLF